MEPILQTRDLTVQFGGHTAVDSVHLSVRPNEFKSIIGPNGAGKTTLFQLLSGQLKPTRGSVLFKGADVTRLSPPHRTRLGMGRSFQLTNVFPQLTVLENVRLAVQSRAGVRFAMFADYRRYRAFEDASARWLETVRLADKRHTLAKQLAHGEQRKLEIAMLLALETELLLLDEPTAGMSLDEVPSILEVIRAIKASGSRTIVLIEHKIDMVLDLSDSVAVLFNGRLLADGTPDEMMRDERVQAAYLGGFDR